MASDYAPLGFCPHCGFATDAGRCSECGQDISDHELQRSPHWLRRKKARKRISLTVAVAIAVGGGFYVSQSGRWCRLLPTSVLLLIQRDEQARATVELFRRYKNGDMAASEIARLFEQAMLPPRIDMLSSLPIAVDTSARFHTYVSRIVTESQQPSSNPETADH